MGIDFKIASFLCDLLLSSYSETEEVSSVFRHSLFLQPFHMQESGLQTPVELRLFPLVLSFVDKLINLPFNRHGFDSGMLLPTRHVGQYEMNAKMT